MHKVGDTLTAIWRKGEVTPWFNLWSIIGFSAVLCFGLIVLSLGAMMKPDRSGPVFNVSEGSCLFASDNIISAQDAIVNEHFFQCHDDNIPINTKQFWFKLPLVEAGLTADELNLEGDTAPIDALHIVHHDKGGNIVTRTILPDEIMQFWTAGTRFSVPLTKEEVSSETLWLGVDKPWSRLAVNDLEIMSLEQAREERFDRTIWFAIFCGLGFLPIIYSISFFVALRYTFMGWHALMSLCFLIYTFSSSGLIMQFLPQIAMWTRTLLSYTALSTASAFAGYFVISFLEKDVVPHWVKRFMAMASHLLIANALFVLIVGPYLPFIARNIYHLAFLPAIISLLIGSTYALTNKSKVVWFLIGGWSLTAIVALDRIFRGMDIYILPPELDFSLFPCLVLEVIITAGGVAYRVMSIRYERDEARMRERELARQATTDLLTGLGNRRQFEEDFAHSKNAALALLDIDNFKQVNDNFGHQVGDEVLQKLGEVLQSFSDQDWCQGIYRLGGEEFAVLLSLQSEDAAAICCEQIRVKCEKIVEAQVDALSHAITISIGVALGADTGKRALYRNADVALYHAKSEGRNCVAIANKAYGRSAKPFLQVAVGRGNAQGNVPA
ncbi:sensor domain-containing diguanylate cyclase [Parasphingorhabdus sp. DH2-15]|uniref:sensor domain-containing diguanylate cyclase n=1 Tax=Parasphingorhabdus sp. DH2-15 TaxID=3444112 RepID=UPI003F6866DB